MILHVTVHTKSLEDSIAFYEKYIGLKIAGDLRGHGAPIVFMAADKNDETKLELIEDKDAYSGEGISIGFPTDDLEGKREHFISEGLEVTGIISPNPNVKFFFVTDPNGLKVQLMPA